MYLMTVMLARENTLFADFSLALKALKQSQCITMFVLLVLQQISPGTEAKPNHPHLSSLNFCMHLLQSCHLTLQDFYFFLLLFLCFLSCCFSLCLSRNSLSVTKAFEPYLIWKKLQNSSMVNATRNILCG